ncbi:MAG: hypothetical protein HYV53_03270 [Parcubacteria group bacterium]|nr:hypothetical protein [Parcubacteria group bacterium]
MKDSMKDSMSSHSDAALALIIIACEREGNKKMMERAEKILEARAADTTAKEATKERE